MVRSAHLDQIRIKIALTVQADEGGPYVSAWQADEQRTR